jgi:anti-sigma-K factor RskA
MSRELKFPVGGRSEGDEEMARLLAPLYAAPADEAYWDDLHARILRRVRNGAEDGAWWDVLSHWARAGAAAAVLVAALAGALLLQHQATEARLAYEAMLSQSPVYSLHMATQQEGTTTTPVDPTLRYGMP